MEVVKQIINHDPTLINLKSENRSALYYAIANTHTDIVDYLLANGAKFNLTYDQEAITTAKNKRRLCKTHTRVQKT
ncbi:MAG: ankyrin repeat domain-containing protein [Rickettsiaceae bacterium H1]|nr:ankyrin repeat domain-containing protein [Rickettsiaceae bacterium H1]